MPPSAWFDGDNGVSLVVCSRCVVEGDVAAASPSKVPGHAAAAAVAMAVRRANSRRDTPPRLADFLSEREFLEDMTPPWTAGYRRLAALDDDQTKQKDYWKERRLVNLMTILPFQFTGKGDRPQRSSAGKSATPERHFTSCKVRIWSSSDAQYCFSLLNSVCSFFTSNSSRMISLRSFCSSPALAPAGRVGAGATGRCGIGGCAAGCGVRASARARGQAYSGGAEGGGAKIVLSGFDPRRFSSASEVSAGFGWINARTRETSSCGWNGLRINSSA